MTEYGYLADPTKKKGVEVVGSNPPPPNPKTSSNPNPNPNSGLSFDEIGAVLPALDSPLNQKVRLQLG